MLNEDVMGQVLDPENVSRAYEQVKRNDGAPGVDGMSVAAYAEHAAHHWPALRRSYGKGPTDLERCAA